MTFLNTNNNVETVGIVFLINQLYSIESKFFK